MTALLIIDKPAGVTSHDVVDRVRRLFRLRRVGHTGTLDPIATGVLVLCLGQATRLAEYLSASRKHYLTEVVFGLETDTLDLSGQVLREMDASHLDEADLRRLLPAFRGKIAQVPPMVSARHHEGRRLYELAREGVTIPREAREVEIFHLELTAFIPGSHPMATLDVTCSTGTYIRSLAADFGEAAGTGAAMRSLRRMWVGDERMRFRVENAYSLDALEELAKAGRITETVLPLHTALSGWPTIRLDDDQVRRIGHGQQIPLREISNDQRTNWPPDPDGRIALLDSAGDVIAIARLDHDQVRPLKVLTHDAGA